MRVGSTLDELRNPDLLTIYRQLFELKWAQLFLDPCRTRKCMEINRRPALIQAAWLSGECQRHFIPEEIIA